MTKKIVALSMFSNVGVAETYFERNGISVAVANEKIPERAKFYEHLYPNTKMICGDITNKNVFEKVREESIKNNVNMIIATPPCQGMSCAGIKDPRDPRNALIYYAIEMIKEIKPKFVIIENVPMQQHTKILYKGVETLIPDYIEAELSKLYNFNKNRIVNSENYGVPQSRRRYILLLTLKKLDFQWEFSEPSKKIITLREAIGHLPSLDPNLRDKDEKWRFPDYEKKAEIGRKVSKWHVPPIHSWRQVEWMVHTPSGVSAFKNKHYFPCKDGRRIKGAPRTYMRLDWNKPGMTILQNSGAISTFSTVHPGHCLVDSEDDRVRIYSDARTLTIYELLIITSLPLDWDIPDWASNTLIRKVIGEGIPPKLIEDAIKQLKKYI